MMSNHPLRPLPLALSLSIAATMACGSDPDADTASGGSGGSTSSVGTDAGSPGGSGGSPSLDAGQDAADSTSSPQDATTDITHDNDTVPTDAGADAFQDPGPDAWTEAGGDTGTYFASMWNTYYYVALESDYPGPKDAELRGPGCEVLAIVPQAFFDDLCIEGSGKLSDGRVLGYAGDCGCATPCSWDGNAKCWEALDPQQFPWGLGSQGNPIVPLRSWAVDNGLVAPGTTVYATGWDGVSMPAIDGLGGFVHDGCFRADDTGGAVIGNHYDFFAGTAGMWHALEAIFPTGTPMDVHVNAERCAYLAP